MTADTALRLAQHFRTTPQFWMHMQANFDLKAAMVRGRALKLARTSAGNGGQGATASVAFMAFLASWNL